MLESVLECRASKSRLKLLDAAIAKPGMQVAAQERVLLLTARAFVQLESQPDSVDKCLADLDA